MVPIAEKVFVKEQARALSNVNMINLCINQLSCYDLVRVNRNIMFIFTKNQTLVATPLQLFLIKHSHGNYVKRLQRLKKVVESGGIKSISDLVTYNGFMPGNNISQFNGLELIRMDPGWVK